MKIAFHLLFPSVSITNVATHTPVTTHTNQPGNGSAHALKKREFLSKRADEAAQRSSPGENRDGGAACGVRRATFPSTGRACRFGPLAKNDPRRNKAPQRHG
ncbi:uncharacterized protein CCOS01_16317 [Colletotrichum costaricense]|uniref:Secreted protein n=1 Tax=Colletotrichum costaricense TaxID=1209916 RepID=A0AAI9YFV7_9PEZI|nr:uncharacterized protein CCOS01_16317 [Colletotrichum costaricense]KAK1507058.1 hypothetical protein CCOS01_16317 [Colletotrichum costaricense]